MKDGNNPPVGSSQVSRAWGGIALQTSIGSLLNPGRRWSDDALDALSRAVSLTLWLDRLGPEPDGPQPHEPEDDEYELWERATAAMVAEHESRPASQATS
jgi:hypothetical protein